MVEDPAAIPRKLRRRGGRPSRAEASAKALRGLDLTAVDPVAILRAIAADHSAPASARVAACRALIAARAPDGPDESATGGDPISARAQQLLAARRKAN
jgi:hypothetical protein